jgi:hypothetical protein
MKRWDLRPVELRNLFNPAFSGLLMLRAIEAYQEETEKGMPFSLTLLVLPLCLHRETRNVLTAGSRSHLLRVVEHHPEVLVGFPERASSTLPFTFEGLGFAMQLGAIEVSSDGSIMKGSKRARRTLAGSPEVIACQRVARYVGKSFGQIRDRVTVYATFGVRP